MPVIIHCLKILLSIYLTLVICVFVFLASTASHFDRMETYHRGAEAQINQTYPNINQFARYYLGSAEIENTMSMFYEMKYGLSILYQASLRPLSWGSRSLLEQSNKSRYKAFKQRISASDYQEFVEVLGVFKTVCEKNNLTFILYGGSLLGSFRHFGLIPWDDDLDVLINTSEKARLKMLLGNLTSFVIDAPNNRQWKFYKKCDNKPVNTDTGHTASKQCAKNLKWPYVDIFFFTENATHIWDEIPMYSSTYIFAKKEVYPLVFSPFEHFFLPVPKCTEKVLSKTYNTDLCVTSTYSHKHERSTNDRQVSVACSRLYNFFSFVFETITKEKVFRKLMRKGELFYGTVSKRNDC